MLACKKQFCLILGDSNRVTATHMSIMSKISCVAAKKHDLSCDFANNVWNVFILGAHEGRKGMEENEF